MKITALKQQIKNPERVSIFIDGKYAVSLTVDQILAEKLRNGIEVDTAYLQVLKKLSDEGKMRGKALEWVMLRPHSVRELRDYLYRKQVEKDFANSLVEEFVSRNYVNDETFAIWFAENRRRKNRSDRAITTELRQKGVEQASILNALGALESDDASALQLLVDKLRSRPRYADTQKLMRYLVSKGYSYDDIRRVLQADPTQPEE